jgi:hypothetical protein
MRLLLILLSRQIYVAPSSLLARPSFYSLYMVQRIPRRTVLTLLCSLVNTALAPISTSFGAIGGLTSKLPYNHLVFKADDTRNLLSAMCLQLLCALLDFQSGTARDTFMENAQSQVHAPNPQTNAFRYSLAKLVNRQR